MSNDEARPDRLNEIGVLKRREIEARVIGPIIERFADEFGADRVHELLGDIIIGIAKDQGAALAEVVDNGDLVAFADGMEAWTRGGSLEVDIIEKSANRYAFNVTRCQYAEMYRELGMAELGAALSCNRDGTMVEGFNPNISFTRTQTIMGGASHCDFVYELPESERPVEL